jgi:hypothetical protein
LTIYWVIGNLHFGKSIDDVLNQIFENACNT